MQFDQTEYLDETFEGLELASEQISGITFNNCRFIDCDFSDALLRSCTLTECRFERCNLSLARLDHSHLAEVSFDDCKAIGVDWTRVGWPGSS